LEEKQASAARISIPMYCRNESDAVTVTLLFQKDGQPIPTSDQTVRNNKGELQVQDAYKCGERSEAAPFEVSLNSAAVPKEDHKLKARALVSVNGNLLEASQEFEVHVPKGATSSRDLNPLSSPPQSGTSSLAQAQPRSSNTMALVSAPASSPGVSTQQSPETQLVPSATAVVTPVATDVQIEFNSTPAGASVELDGKYVGKTPTTITVSIGEHQIVIRKPEFGVWQKTLDVTPADRRIAAYLEQRTLNLQ
jgi:hypothetical protein